MPPNDSPGPGTDPVAATAASQAAGAAAAKSFTIQLWTLYTIGLLVTILRTYSRVKTVGIRNLKGDDILIWIAFLFYTAQTVLGYSVSSVAHGLANSGMTDAERLALSPDDPEYHMRVVGSKIQVAGWSLYFLLMCFLKLSVLFFYIRLTQGLGGRYRVQIWMGFGLVLSTTIASLAVVLFSCHPISRNWQIYPDPGDHCQPAISKRIVWVAFASSASTDLYLLMIPLPMLWGSSLRLIKKIASTFVLGAGIFVLVSATLKTVFVIVDPVNGAQLAGAWGTREAFVAIFTTNLPMIFPLFVSWFNCSVLRSSRRNYIQPEEGGDVLTIGGSGGNGSGGRPRDPHRPCHLKRFSIDFSTVATAGEYTVRDIEQQQGLDDVKAGEAGTCSCAPNSVFVSTEVAVFSGKGEGGGGSSGHVNEDKKEGDHGDQQAQRS